MMWCDEHTPLVKFNDHIQNAIDLCVYNVKTVKGKLVQNKKDLNTFLTGQTNNDEKYKVSYAFRKHNEDFLKLIGHAPEEDESEWNPAIDKYKEWCQNSLESEFKDSVYESFLIFCVPKNFSTVKAYLSGRTLLTEDSQKEELQKVHQKISNFDSYKADSIESGEEGLKKWCEENLEKNFSDSLNVLDEILPKVISRCVKGSEITDK
ncbi:hypothetical protein MHF_1137 [Mycoplasma haemofelis Ohio2]|uniref:Uncharacterized protein n=1 Tax=Mycoplasma haemofelis (strain Ohio2) TaxID=859194 RepID=F6FJM5_MYCHI|nr:hypothetical protein MHF_1137 [Mycoplasma haemofelis Ohio2]